MMNDPEQALNTRKRSPRLFVRQRKLLALLGTLGGSVGNLDFQKLLFLYCKTASCGGSGGNKHSAL